MPDITPNPEENIALLERTLKKYKIFFFSAVGLLVIGILLFTNYDAGSKLTGYIGPTGTVQKPIIASISSPSESGIVILKSGDPSLKFSWAQAVGEGDATTYKITQFDASKSPKHSYEWQIKDKTTGTTVWELTKAYNGGVNLAEEDKICNIQLNDASQKALDSGLDWTCPYITIQYSQLKKDTDYIFSVRAYDGQTFSDYKTVNFKTKEPVQSAPCTEGSKTSDGVLTCKDGKWITTPQVVDNTNDESVPSLTPKTSKLMTDESATKPAEEEGVPELVAKTKDAVPPSKSDIKITKATLSEKEFNPLLKTVTFTVETSADAKVDIKIYDKSGKAVASPASDKSVVAGKEFKIDWEGDNDAKKTLSAGTYSYKILAKDPTTKEIADTKTGEIMLKYGSVATKDKDFENLSGKTSGSTSASTTQTTQAVPKPSSSNSAATVALQNSTEGKTAGTGPETIIYLIFPILGYTVSRKFK